MLEIHDMIFRRKVHWVTSMGFLDLLHVCCFYCNACFCSWSADLKPGIESRYQVVRMICLSPWHHYKQVGNGTCSFLFVWIFSCGGWRWDKWEANCRRNISLVLLSTESMRKGKYMLDCISSIASVTGQECSPWLIEWV